MMLAKFLAWLKSKNISSHAIAATAVGIATLIMTDQQVRNFILKIFANHPDIGSAVVLIAGTILKYSNPSSPAGSVAAAQVIASSPNPPTQAAVEAAKPKETP